MKSSFVSAALLCGIASASPAYTVTATGPTVTATGPTVVATVPALCNNAGLQWAYNADSQPVAGSVSQNNFDPTVVKKQVPQSQGITNYVGSNDSNPAPTSIYGSASALPGANYILNHRGYMLALESGLYTFNATNVDDILSVWLGPAAYSGWSNYNAQQRVFYNDGPGSNVYVQKLTAGQYYPIRIVFKQGGGGALFNFTITSPSGMQLLGGDPSSQPSPYIVQYSCDGQLAPQYPAFGQET